MEAKRKVVKGPLKKKSIKKQGSQKTYIMYGLGIGAVLGGGYLVYSFLRNRAANQRSIQEPITTITPRDIVTTPTLPVVNRNQFPIRRGARGNLVKMVQRALLDLGGKPALIIKETSIKNGQVDGVFGKGTERALRAAGFTTVLTQGNFTRLVGQEGKTSSFEAGKVAKELINAANKRNLFGVLNGLKKITSIVRYQQVSLFFQQIRILGIRVTSLVNALLSVAFKQKELEKVKIRAEFRRMGLRQNARGVWFIPASPAGRPNLNGMEDFDTVENQIDQEWNLAVAQKPTLLRSEDGTFIVPEVLQNTVVGYITGMQNGVTRILTQSGEIVFAPTQNLVSI